MAKKEALWVENEPYIKGQNRIYQTRVSKVQALRAQGIQPYANGFSPTHLAQTILDQYNQASEALLEQTSVKVAGRVLFLRSFGKAAFVKLLDRSGIIQLHISKSRIGNETFEIFKKVDIGDIIGASGYLFKTRTGELTIAVQDFVLLTKSLRPLPEKFHGLSDVETRFRQRYVDLIVNQSARKIFRTRAKIIRYLRDFFHQRDFLEVETPMMHPTPGGAAAKPFVTHHNALDIDLYLRIAPELYLKRLLVGGLERVFEINRNFRNEGLSRRHNPEFTMLEFYWAYATYEDLMDLTETLFEGLAKEVLGTTELNWNGQEISLARPWKRLRIREGVAQALGIDESELDQREVLEKWVQELPEPLSKAQAAQMGKGKLLIEIFEQKVEQNLIQPTFILEYPSEVSPLSRRNEQNPEWVDRFELMIGGMEIANAFSELNDPLDQRQRFIDQLKARMAGDDEAHPMDEDYVRALEYGMPPAAGQGIGIDRLVMLFTGADSIREVILFPQLRPES